MLSKNPPPDKTAIHVNGLNFEYLWVKNTDNFHDGSWSSACETPEGQRFTFASRDDKGWSLYSIEKPLSDFHELRKFELRWPNSGIRKSRIFQVLPNALEHDDFSKCDPADDLLIYHINYWNNQVEMHVNGDENRVVIAPVADLMKYAKPYMPAVFDAQLIEMNNGPKKTLGELHRDFPTTSLIEYFLKGHVRCHVTVYENYKEDGHGCIAFYKAMENFNVSGFREISSEKKKGRDLVIGDGRKVGLINTTPRTDTAIIKAPYSGKVILMMTEQPDGNIDIPLRVKNDIAPYLASTGSKLTALSKRYETLCNPLFLTILGMGVWKREQPKPQEIPA